MEIWELLDPIHIKSIYTQLERNESRMKEISYRTQEYAHLYAKNQLIKKQIDLYRKFKENECPFCHEFLEIMKEVKSELKDKDKIIKENEEKIQNLEIKIINKTRRPLNRALRHEVFKRDGYRCLECGATNKNTHLHLDHIIPVAQGGSDELSNLQTLCETCNIAKSNRAWKGGD